MLLEPPALAPGGVEVGLALRSFQFPDDRSGQLWRLGAWIPAGARHEFLLSVDYALIESNSDLRSGGGPLGLQWTGRWWQRGWARIESDCAFRAPNGDGALHPLSAKAPSLQARLRLGAVRGDAFSFWVAYFGQRVSPPADSQFADELFPSGSGLDLVAQADRGAFGAVAEARRAQAGLASATWLSLSLSLALSDELSLRVGGMASPGPRDERLMESGWRLELRWHPAPAATPAPTTKLERPATTSLSSRPAPLASR